MPTETIRNLRSVVCQGPTRKPMPPLREETDPNGTPQASAPVLRSERRDVSDPRATTPGQAAAVASPASYDHRPRSAEETEPAVLAKYRSRLRSEIARRNRDKH